MKLTNSLKTLIQSFSIPYKGTTITKKGSGYVVLGRYCKDLTEVDRVLEEARNNLEKSIINNNGTQNS